MRRILCGVIGVWIAVSIAAAEPVRPHDSIPDASRLPSAGESLAPYRNSHPRLERAVRRQQMRDEFIGMAALIDRLAVREGMSILDIGAGPGYASFLFAERLHGSGQVLATDIREDFVTYIREEAARRGLPHLSAVRVRADGLDAAYAQHRYDLVLLSNVYHCLQDRVDYFSKLKPLLQEGARLVLIMYNPAPLFDEKDFFKIFEVADALTAEPEGSPFVAGLSEETRLLLASRADLERLKTALVEDFNRQLRDPWFYKNFYKNSYFDAELFSPGEREMANWLLMGLAETGALGAPIAGLPEQDVRALLRLNRLFFVKRFGGALAQGGRGAYIPAGDANRHTSKYVMLRELGAAGYALSRDIRLSAYFDALILVSSER